MERLTYDRTAKAVTYRSDTSDDPTAGTETVDPLELLARVLAHIPDTGHETTRCDCWSANRPRGMCREAEPAAATRRWATLLQQIVEVDPLACSRGHGVMRLVACITPPSVIEHILAHRGARAATPAHAAARSPPSTRGPPGRAPRDDPPRPTKPAARQPALAGSAIAPYVRPILDRSRLTFPSRTSRRFPRSRTRHHVAS